MCRSTVQQSLILANLFILLLGKWFGSDSSSIGSTGDTTTPTFTYVGGTGCRAIIHGGTIKIVHHHGRIVHDGIGGNGCLTVGIDIESI